MNAKKARALRALAKSVGADFRDARYVPVEHTRRQKLGVLPHLGLDDEGKPQGIPYQTVTFALDPQCGRAAYRQLKRIAA